MERETKSACGTGGITGPMIGGFLANPVQYYPFLEPLYFFNLFPYYLPCFVCSLVLLFGFVFGFFFLTETLPKTKSNKKIEQEEYATLEEEENFNQQNDESHVDPVHEKAKFYTTRQTITSTLNNVFSIFKDRPIVVSSVVYSLLGLVYIMWDDVFPLWMMLTPSEGGIQFSPRQIGIVNSVAGVFVGAFSLFVTQFVIQRVGLRNTLRIGIVFGFFSFAIIPNVTYLHASRTWWPHTIPEIARSATMWIILLGLMLVRVCAGQFAFTSVMICINNSADSSQKGQANGLGQSLVAFTRAVGPAAAGSIFSATISSGLSYVDVFLFSIL